MQGQTFLSKRPIFRVRNLLARPIGLAKNGRNDLDITRNIGFCSVLPKQHLQPSFLMCFYQKSSQRGFCSLNVVLTSKIRFASKDKFHNSNTSVYKGVRKNMLKTWDFTKNKLWYRCFDNNFQKIFQTNILKDGTVQILLIIVG